MFNLMKLEMKKIKIGGYIRSSFIIYVVLAALLILIMSTQDNSAAQIEAEEKIKSLGEILDFTSILSKVTFIIFASVLLSRFVIDEFRSKTMNIMFMYPINRKKIIISKLFFVFIFTFVNIILSNIFVNAIFFIYNSFTHVQAITFDSKLLVNHSISVIITAISASFISMIPLYFGMRKYSVPTTIVSSIIVTCLLSSSFNGDMTLNDIIIIPIVFSIVGIIIAYLAIINIEKVDMSN